MATSVEELVDVLFEMIDDAKGVIMSPDKCTIERDKALDLLDDIRAQLPVELSEAKKLLATKNEYIAAAKREAEEIKAQAEETAKQMVDQETITSMARAKGADIIKDAEERSSTLKNAANEYCEDLLKRTEDAIAEAYREIQTSHSHFRSASVSEVETKPSGRTVYDAEADF